MLTVNLCVCTQTGESSLSMACTKGDMELVKSLCEIGGEELMMLTNEVSLPQAPARCGLQLGRLQQQAAHVLHIVCWSRVTVSRLM
jgi:hypothetical protein